MSEPDRKPSASDVSNTTKTDVLRKCLFDGHSVAELSQDYGVSQAQIEDWKEQAREHLEAVFEPDSASIEALCRELTALKKELGEL
jgi:transposase-like protein